MRLARIIILLTLSPSLAFIANPPQAARALTRPCVAYQPPARPTATVRIAVLGDSLAQGYGASDGVVCGFAPQLPSYLPAQMAGVAGVVTIAADGGMRADQMVAAVPALADTKPDILIIELGTNDEREGWPVAGTQAALSAILATFAGAPTSLLATRAIFCLSVWPSPGHDDPATLAAYNAAIAAACANAGGELVDITALANPVLLTDVVTTGNWHPNDAGAAAIATLLVQRAVSDGVFAAWCAPRVCLPSPTVTPLPPHGVALPGPAKTAPSHPAG